MGLLEPSKLIRWGQRQGWWAGALALAALLGSEVLARDIFVDNLGGDDRNTGRALQSEGKGTGPVRTINKALRLCMPGDSIILTPHELEPYRESITLTGHYHSGTTQSPVRIIGNGAVLDGLAPVENAPWEPVGKDLYAVTPRLVNPQTVFFGTKQAPKPLSRQEIAAGKSPAAGQWYLQGGQLFLKCDKDSAPDFLRPQIANYTVGITLVDVHDVEISDLKVRGFQIDGINAHDNVTRTNLTRVTVEGCGRSGISVGGCSRVLIDSCDCQGNLQAQLRTEGFCEVQLYDNKFGDDASTAIVKQGGKVTDGEK